MQPPTPRAVFDQYALLPPESRREFLRLLGGISAAEDALLIVSEFSLTERFRFSELAMNEMVMRHLPILVQQARQLARERPELTDEAFDAELLEQVRILVEGQAREIAALEREQLKGRRDRKSDPEIVKRNVEICDLRKRDPTTWSQGRLASHFHLTSRAIRKILAEEDKWRRLVAGGGPTS